MRPRSPHGSIVDLCLVSGTFSLGLPSLTCGPLNVVKLPGKGATTSSVGIIAGKTLYVAGQDGRKSDGSLPKDFQQELDQSLRNVQAVLRTAQMDLSDVIWMHVYVKNARDLDEMDDVYWKQLITYPPGHTVLVVGDLPDNEKVEISCIATLPCPTPQG